MGCSPFSVCPPVGPEKGRSHVHSPLEGKGRRPAWSHLPQHEILELPGGYDALLTERGANLSGGQRQRLAIARILLKQPPVLILDEAASALDNISERAVQRALGLTSADRTTIIVAHRLSTLRDADRIRVFSDGHIAEAGAYPALVQRGGLFSELVLSAENGVSSPVPEETMARSALRENR